eukprot:TRINITY_DN4895_c1_g4_i3.p1 TRINITY_DN4895_c1_g4~~TRINITY_DN4895_c1_g4_i3.p1  ORF type:complete len:340 (+),score=69.26 TRINITY_DN4895_c1_g4_i3:102-1121(+)
MYIGPWQEYKLARLIQQQHVLQAQQSASSDTGHRSSSSTGLRGRDAVAASPTSSSRSGFSGLSTQSAPVQSSQARLNDYCDGQGGKAERRNRPWAPPRPRDSGSSSATGSTRPFSSSSAGSATGRGFSQSNSVATLPSPRGRGGAGRKGGGPKKSGKPPKAASFEEIRRKRIKDMQKLYGLQGDEGGEPAPEEGKPQAAHQGGLSNTAAEDRTGPLATFASLAGGTAALAAVTASASNATLRRVAPSDGQSEIDLALNRLRSSIDAHESLEVPNDQQEQVKPHELHHLRLPSLPEDPAAITQMSMSMGSSGGLIDWCKNLKPEELSPTATLASFFNPIE